MKRLAWLPLALLLTACGAEELPTAADGTDLAACADGRCEVRVSTGDRFDCPDLGPVEVTISDDMLEVAHRTDDGQGNGSSLSASGVAGQELSLNGQLFTVVAVLGDEGVLRVGE